MVLTLAPIPWVAVLASLVASMVIGFLWYSPWLFAPRWVQLAKIDIEASKKRGMALPLTLSAISSIVTSIALTQLFPILGVASIANAVVAAFFVWLCFHALITLTTMMFQGQSFELFLIVGGHDLVWILASAVIIQTLS